MLKNVKKMSCISVLIFIIAGFSICADAQGAYVVPSGEAVGVKIYSDGILVVGMSPDSPAKDCGIKVNDCIKYANGTELKSSEQFASIVNQCHDELTLTVERNGESQNISAIPSESEDGIYRLGLWVRDSTAGIGTLTYYNPENNTFAALGHGITDVDTGNILTVKSGNILPCRILSVQKSENGNPGGLNGSFDGAPLGEISLNSDRGIFGTYTSPVQSEAIPVASPSEIEKGAAYILANVDGGGVKQYSIEITKVSQKANKNMVIEITDETLLSLTGGIIQGMSGAPIIQNGKLAGAVTHVFVNNSAKGYGVFAENMIEVSENLE